MAAAHQTSSFPKDLPYINPEFIRGFESMKEKLGWTLVLTRGLLYLQEMHHTRVLEAVKKSTGVEVHGPAGHLDKVGKGRDLAAAALALANMREEIFRFSDDTSKLVKNVLSVFQEELEAWEKSRREGRRPPGAKKAKYVVPKPASTKRRAA